MITQQHCAVILNKDTFARDFSCTPIQVPCSLRYLSWAVEGMVVTGKFRRAPDPSCSYFTVASVHISNEYAKRRSVCSALLLLTRDLCMKLGAVILSGDFNKGAQRELASSAPTSVGSLRSRPPSATLYVPWPTSGVTPLWGPGGELQGCLWPEWCGFVVLPESQRHWLIMRHGSINVVPATIGLKTTDQTWHYEQWPRLKFAGRKRRSVAFLADTKSRQKCLLHTNK